MPKTPITLAPDLIADAPRRWKLRPILATSALALLLAPVVLDAVMLCYGQWRDLLGRPVDVRTPTLDAIADRTADAREWLWYHASSGFHRVPWDPGVVLAVAVGVMVLSMMMIRR